jgi:hypothetical protein
MAESLKIDITMPFEVNVEDIDIMIDAGIYRQSSPWIWAITRHDHAAGPIWTVKYDGENDDEGSHKSRGSLTRLELLEAFAKAAAAQWRGEHFGLCCLDDMLQDKSLGIGCAQDSDVVMQYALLGELVYG